MVRTASLFRVCGVNTGLEPRASTYETFIYSQKRDTMNIQELPSQTLGHILRLAVKTSHRRKQTRSQLRLVSKSFRWALDVATEKRLYGVTVISDKAQLDLLKKLERYSTLAFARLLRLTLQLDASHMAATFSRQGLEELCAAIEFKLLVPSFSIELLALPSSGRHVDFLGFDTLSCQVQPLLDLSSLLSTLDGTLYYLAIHNCELPKSAYGVSGVNGPAQQLFGVIGNLCKLRTLDLCLTKLDEGHLNVLVQARGLSSLIRLDLSQCRMETGCMASVATLVERNPLETLSLSYNKVRYEGLLALAPAFKASKTLKHLYMDRVFLEDIILTMDTHAQDVIKLPTELRTLTLRENSMSDGVIGVGRALTHCTRLKELDLQFNRLHVSHVISIVKSLSFSLKSLGLSHNAIGPVGLTALSMCSLPANLERLYLGYNQMDDEIEADEDGSYARLEMKLPKCNIYT
jgi:Leucine-rich repeat (LRR) protein